MQISIPFLVHVRKQLPKVVRKEYDKIVLNALSNIGELEKFVYIHESTHSVKSRLAIQKTARVMLQMSTSKFLSDIQKYATSQVGLEVVDKDIVAILKFSHNHSDNLSYVSLLKDLHHYVMLIRQDESSSDNREIEKKVLITGFPTQLPISSDSVYEIRQSYISTDPEIRVRLKTTNSTGEKSYRVALKSRGNLSRREYQFEIDLDMYASIISRISSKPIVKEYKVYDFHGHKLECSLVDNDFYYAEIEFDSIEEAKNFDVTQIPNYVADVTDDSNYKMATYWEHTHQNKK